MTLHDASKELIVEIALGSNWERHLVDKDTVDLLNSISSRKLSIKPVSKYQLDNSLAYVWGDNEKHPDHQIETDKYYIGGGVLIVPLVTFTSMFPSLSFEIRCTIASAPAFKPEVELLGKLSKLEQRLSEFDFTNSFNTKVGVHISDLGLLAVRHVDWLEDACTQELQRKLNDGWRILAVCPQPDSRRPDYILGRNEPE